MHMMYLLQPVLKKKQNEKRHMNVKWLHALALRVDLGLDDGQRKAHTRVQTVGASSQDVLVLLLKVHLARVAD